MKVDKPGTKRPRFGTRSSATMTHLSSILGTGKANSTPLGPGSWCWPVVASKTIFIHRVAFPPTWRVTISAVTTFGKTDFSCRGRSSRLRFLTFDSFAFSVEVNHQAKFLHTNGFSRRVGFVSRHRMTGRKNVRRSWSWTGQQFFRIEWQLSRGNWTWRRWRLCNKFLSSKRNVPSFLCRYFRVGHVL